MSILDLVKPWGDVLTDFASSTGPLVSSAWMGTVLIIYGLFISHTGEFTRFLHRMGGGLFLFSLWSLYHGSFLRRSSIQDFSFFDSMQQDSVFFRLFFFYSTLILVLFFFGRSSRHVLSKRTPREFRLLILFMHFGGIFLFRFSTFIDLFLAFEIVTLASYVLVSFERQNRFSTYVGIQYFLVGSIPSARILLGFSFFYLYGGSLVIQDLDLRLNTSESFRNSTFTSLYQQNTILLAAFFSNDLSESTDTLGNFMPFIENELNSSTFFPENTRDSLFSSTISYTTITRRGFLFIIFNLFFKLTAAPFHFWAPSVYGKAPIASVTFLSIYSKVRVFFFIYSLLSGFLSFASSIILFLFIFSGLLSVFVGRVGAFVEKRIKRFFVFSSRGHVGFRLAGFSIRTKEGVFAVFHYLTVYMLSSFLRWYILFSRGRDKTYRNQFTNLKLNQPLLAIFFAFLLFSRSGIPPFAGFFVKLDILSALFDSSHFFVNYVFFFFTVASFFYYLRPIKILFFDQSNEEHTTVPLFKHISVSAEHTRSDPQNWMRSSIFLFLTFYIFFVQKSIFILLNERLLSH